MNPFDNELFFGFSNNSQDMKEQDDAIQVQIKGSKYVILWGQAVFVFSSKHKLDVNNKILEKKFDIHL